MLGLCMKRLFSVNPPVAEISLKYCQADQITYLIACGILSLLITCANLVVIIVYLKTTNDNLRNSQTIYRTSMAFSDLIIGAFVLPTFIAFWTFKRQLVWSVELKIGWDVYGFLTTLSYVVSLSTLVISSLERIFAIVFPIKYHVRKGCLRKTAFIASVVIWCFGILLSFVPLYSENAGYGETMSRTVKILYISSSNTLAHGIVLIFAIFSLIASGIAMFILVKFRKAGNLSSSASGRWRVEKRVAITQCIMILAFVFSVSPAIILLMVGNGYGGFFQPLKTYIAVEAGVVYIYYTNSLWNCFVYSFRSKIFRDEAKKVFYPLIQKLKCPRLGNRDLEQPIPERIVHETAV